MRDTDVIYVDGYMGCGDGVLGRLLLGSTLRWIGIDLSLTVLSGAPRPAVLGDAACLPFFV